AVDFPQSCGLVLGQEGPCLSEAIHAGAQATLSIAQYGSTRPINPGSAAGIAMHAWIRQAGGQTSIDQRVALSDMRKDLASHLPPQTTTPQGAAAPTPAGPRA